MVSHNYRQRELDFLRGIAILLVLCRHSVIIPYLSMAGWIGVDLFFVLSGFLVSGLLFREYLSFGNIRVGNFLVRRAFKIYPVYYIFYPIYLFQLVRHHTFQWVPFLGDMFFVQNYVLGAGYAQGATWSLAVEEHFYLALSFVLWILFNRRKRKQVTPPPVTGAGKVVFCIGSLMFLVLIARIIYNFIFPEITWKHYTLTHLRMDSLLAGVLVSYLYHFHKDVLEKAFNKIRPFVLPAVFLLLSFTPFIDFNDSIFVRTFGYSFIYTAFGLMLVLFLLTKDINKKLDSLFGKYIVTVISKIGVYSYCIYIIQTFVIRRIRYYDLLNPFGIVLFFLISILLGMLMSMSVERFFLGLRDKYYPKRAKL